MTLHGRCSVCGEARVLDREPFLLQARDKLVGRDLLRSVARGGVFWACRECLQAGPALEGALRHDCSLCPVLTLAYVDLPMRCEACGSALLFTAREQHWWHRHLFDPRANRPRRCLPCRRSKRQKDGLLRALQAELAHLPTEDLSRLVRIGVLYEALGSPQKSRAYLHRASRQAKGSPERLAKLVEQERKALATIRR